MTISRRTALSTLGAGLSAAAGSLFSFKPAHAAKSHMPVVVELFTSQGCHSCPPAERFLAELARRPDIIPLEFHVDYWDYIGWKDPFADPLYTARQRAYNGRLGSAYVYTPQMIIDGVAHEVGSRRDAVNARIEAAQMKRILGPNAPKLSITQSASGALDVALDGQPDPARSYEILMAGFDNTHETDVTRGENTGKRLVNTHVVRSLKRLGDGWQGGPWKKSVSMASGDGNGGCAVLVQNTRTGIIAAASQILLQA